MGRMLYSYDPHTKEYTSAEPERIDPITGTKIKRLFSTDKQPPEKLDGHVIRFDESTQEWEQLPDHRDKTFFFRNSDGDIEAVVIKELGEIPDYYYEKRSDIPKTKHELGEHIRRKRNAKLNATDVLMLRKLEELSATIDDAELQSLIQQRQALRDVPQQEGFPNDIVWPEEQ